MVSSSFLLRSFRSALPLLVLIVGALVVVALAGFIPSQFGHTGANELAFVTQVVNVTCTDKFCSAVCPAGYRVSGGGCGVAAPRFAQFNLSGASGDQTAWDCFDSAYVPSLSAVQANALCVKVGNAPPAPYEFCGNYTIEPIPALPSNLVEICDMNNTAPYDCTDFFTSGGQQLCNSFLSCTSNCGVYDVSQCEYCSPAHCTGGQILCNDGSCRMNCDGFGGGIPSGTFVGSGTCGTPGVACPDVDSPTLPFAGVCGDGAIGLGEACDVGAGASNTCPQQTSLFCAPGDTLHVVVQCNNCNCEDASYCQGFGGSCPGGAPNCTDSTQCNTGETCTGGCCIGVFEPD